MTDKEKFSMREALTDSLPDAIAKALGSYRNFMKQAIPEEAKEFSAHHNAAKVAIAHIELLCKLGKLAELDLAETQEGHETALLDMLKKAEKELDAYKSKQE